MPLIKYAPVYSADLLVNTLGSRFLFQEKYIKGYLRSINDLLNRFSGMH